MCVYVCVFSCERVCATVTWAGNVQPRIPHWISLIQPYKRLSCFCSMQKTWKRVVEKRPQPEKHFSSSKKISPRNFRSFARTKEDHRALFPWTKKKTHTIEIEQNDEVSNIAIGYYVVEKYFPSNPSRKKVMLWCGVAAMFRKFCASVYRAPGKIWAFKFWKRNLRVFIEVCFSPEKKPVPKWCLSFLCVSQCHKTFFIMNQKRFSLSCLFEQCSNRGFSCFFLCWKKIMFKLGIFRL